MAFDFSFDFDHKLVYVAASAKIDLASGVEAMRVLLSDNRFEKDMRILVDLREVDYALSAEEVIKLLPSPVWRAIIDGHQIAVVAGKPVQFGMANVLARKTGDAVTMQPFYTVEEAMGWLRIGPDSEIQLRVAG